MKVLQKNIKFLLIVLFATTAIQAVLAQPVVDLKRSADRFYDKGDYYSAAVYYEKYLSNDKSIRNGSTEPYTVQGKGGAVAATKNTKRQEVVYRIAESYRQLHNYTQAEKWYAEASTQSDYPLANLWYGVVLKANGKFDAAGTAFQAFAAAYKQQDTYSELAKREIASVQFIQQQEQRKDRSQFQSHALAFNGGSADYAVAAYQQNLVFTSSRPDSSLLKTKKNPYRNQLYQVADMQASSNTVASFGIPTTDGMEQGVASFSADGNTAFFTQWTKKDNKNIASIYVSQKQSETWSVPQLVSGGVNQDGYSSQQPFVTTDGKFLLFASDKPGGQGKFDLYAASLNGTQVGKPTNLGKNINTKEDEQSPFYHQSSQTLVFANNGRVGMGGFDLFAAKGELATANWQSPENLGWPVNSIKDDLYFYAANNGKLLNNAIISSDRSSECCLQVFTVNKTYKKYVTGLVTDCKTGQPIVGANLTLSRINQNIASLNTNADGSYIIELSDFEVLQLAASKQGYTSNSLSFDQPNASADTLTNQTICLTPIELEPPVVTPPQPEPTKKPQDLNVYFDFAKHDLKQETGVLMDTIAAIMLRETKLGLEIYGYTDKFGTPTYNYELSRRRAEACKVYLMQKGIDASRIKVKSMGECCPIKPETKPDGTDDPEARKLNRRVEFKIVLLQL